MTTEEAIGHIKDIICENNNIKPNIVVFEQEKEALYMAIKALKQGDALDKVRAEIERLHYHPKLDFVRNDDVVDMALDIIDKCRAEQGGVNKWANTLSQKR